MSRTIRLTGRFHRGVPLDRAGFGEETLDLDADKTALVALHCWNIGCLDGPAVDNAFRVGMGSAELLEAGYRVMCDRILPAMQAARGAGILVAHVENLTIGRKHLDLMEVPPTQQRTEIEGDEPPPAVPGHFETMQARAHGRGFLTDSPYARMDRVGFLMPQPGEPFAMDSVQFHRVLHGRGIENLIYTGFAADMCILRSGGGIADMARHYSYRVLIIREATLGVELDDWLDRGLATAYGLRQVEAFYGHSVAWDEWMAQCEALRTP